MRPGRLLGAADHFAALASHTERTADLERQIAIASRNVEEVLRRNAI